MQVIFFILLLSSADIFQNKSFQKILSEALSECQTVRAQIRTDVLSVLIWAQTSCKCYRQTTTVAANKGICAYVKSTKISLGDAYIYGFERKLTNPFIYYG